MNRDSPRKDGPSRLRDRFREATANAIVDAAEQVISQHGLAAARMEDIAEQAGVAVGTVYNHFSDRNALLVAVIEARAKELLARLDVVLESGVPFEQMLRDFVRTSLEHHERHRHFFGVLFQSLRLPAPRSAPPDETGLPCRNAFLEPLGRAERLVARGVECGALRPLPPDLLSILIVGVMAAAGLRSVRRHTALSPSDTEQIVDLILKGIGTR